MDKLFGSGPLAPTLPQLLLQAAPTAAQGVLFPRSTGGQIGKALFQGAAGVAPLIGQNLQQQQTLKAFQEFMKSQAAAQGVGQPVDLPSVPGAFAFDPATALGQPQAQAQPQGIVVQDLPAPPGRQASNFLGQGQLPGPETQSFTGTPSVGQPVSTGPLFPTTLDPELTARLFPDAAPSGPANFSEYFQSKSPEDQKLLLQLLQRGIPKEVFFQKQDPLQIFNQGDVGIDRNRQVQFRVPPKVTKPTRSFQNRRKVDNPGLSDRVMTEVDNAGNVTERVVSAQPFPTDKPKTALEQRATLALTRLREIRVAVAEGDLTKIPVGALGKMGQDVRTSLKTLTDAATLGDFEEDFIKGEMQRSVDMLNAINEELKRRKGDASSSATPTLERSAEDQAAHEKQILAKILGAGR